MTMVPCGTNIYFGSYADNNTIHVAGAIIDDLILSLQESSEKL